MSICFFNAWSEKTEASYLISVGLHSFTCRDNKASKNFFQVLNNNFTCFKHMKIGSLGHKPLTVNQKVCYGN